MSERYLGFDVGAETIKVVELVSNGSGELRRKRRRRIAHHQEPATTLKQLFEAFDVAQAKAATVTGRFAGLCHLEKVPLKQAQAVGSARLSEEEALTVVSIGGHGFSVLEKRDSGLQVFRENSRCSQGTGNFLAQLVARFGLSIEAASELCADVADPSALSGRCPVILKTDMTHLANKGESQPRILAGLYDAVCENVQVLIKPRISPKKVLLTGGVSFAPRIRENFKRFFERHQMELLPINASDAVYCEALGCAALAAQQKSAIPKGNLLRQMPPARLEQVDSLAQHVAGVTRMTAPATSAPSGKCDLALGFDIGSTGSKIVAIDLERAEPVWQSYINTNGNPVAAAQTLMRHFKESELAKQHVVRVLGATGSGREIVGSLLSSCYRPEQVYVLNEIAAHAEGALHFEPRVDTIFEIGGQDAKYIRLADGRVVDAAMNEACSAGTGSFIEEQGKKFRDVEDVVQLGEIAKQAECGVSLGQHCSVFMAEIIDAALGAGVETPAIIAGIYDSIIQNYLNRVKGNRSVGQVIFCQGMPFSADALAAAVVRQTGAEVIIPPNPGTVGALGIALLARRFIDRPQEQPALDPRRLLEAKFIGKDTFICKSTKGCGGSGNRCRIDRIATLANEKRSRFTWGGNCSLWDRGTGKVKLPDQSPDPFAEREKRVDQLLAELPRREGAPSVALTDEFTLKGLLPFFATYLSELGLNVEVLRGADQAVLKRGIEQANVPFCAPMQQFHGLAAELLQRDVDWFFLPMLRQLPRVGDEPNAVCCPIVQGSPDMLTWDLGQQDNKRIVSTRIDFDLGNFQSDAFVQSCQRIARDFGRQDRAWRAALAKATAAQQAFEAECIRIGERTLEYCSEHQLIAAVVLGRPYTIYNKVLNSNVPALLREQGAIAIPVDCYPVPADTARFDDVFWGYGQRNLRAAAQVRRTAGVYSIWCSNYSCGPDSFNNHFYGYLMAGKPFCSIETDGHSGDAGTKTRIEAFLHCVREDIASSASLKQPPREELATRKAASLETIQAQKEHVLIPRMGPGALSLAACLRGVGISAEALPEPDRDTVRIGRRYTSGKECVPMCITIGSLLQRVHREADSDRRFAFFMPTACGPCRFGVYNVLHKIILEQLGEERVRVWSPTADDYFRGIPAGFTALTFTGFTAIDALQEALYDVRPRERTPGAAQALYDQFSEELFATLERAGRSELSLSAALLQVATGQLFGVADLLRRAGVAFAQIATDKALPTVLMVGEIYVRCDPFANDFLVDKLEARGIRVRFAPFNEWLEYTDFVARREGKKTGFGAQLSAFVLRRIQQRVHGLVGRSLGWPARTTVKDSVEAASPWVRVDLCGEAVLTVGGPVHEHREGLIDGVVSVGPLECMPNKVAEAQFFHVTETEGLATLTVPVNGDAIDETFIDSFVFDVKQRFEQNRGQSASLSAVAAVLSS